MVIFQIIIAFVNNANATDDKNHAEVSINAAAVSDWLRSVTCAERGKSQPLQRTQVLHTAERC